MCAFVVLSLVSPYQANRLCWECVWNDLFCVEWDVKPQLSHLIVTFCRADHVFCLTIAGVWFFKCQQWQNRHFCFNSCLRGEPVFPSSRRETVDKWHRLCEPDAFLSPNQQSQSIEGRWKHWLQRGKIPTWGLVLRLHPLPDSGGRNIAASWVLVSEQHRIKFWWPC